MLGTQIVVLLAVATVGLVVGRALRLPAIVAYLLAGVLAGPVALGWVERSPAIEQIAELGVALLLFGVGVEFSLDRLRRELPRMLASGGSQVTLTVALTAFGFHALGERWPVAVFIGFLVSLSSTAIVFKLYDEAAELDAPQGQAAAGILLFQDLALVPMMLFVHVLAGPAEGIVPAAATAILTAAGAIAIVLLLARAVLPRALDVVARLRVPELFPLAGLVAAFGTAGVAVRLGLSLPIGTFLAGLALSGSPYAQQVFAEVLPLRDAFVAIFFTSIGLLLERDVLLAAPALVAGLLGAVAVKAALVAALVALLWRSARLVVLTALALAQIGEFSFVLAHQGAAAGVLTPRLEQAVLAAAILSMAATPFLVRAARRLAHVGAAAPGRGSDLQHHVLVVGYGTTGQAIARVLRETGIAFVAVDMVASNVDAGRHEAIPVRFGDATRRAVLEEMGAARARAAVVTVGDPGATRTIVAILRQLAPRARILVRARRVVDIDELERLGADEVVPSEFETSIELFVRLLTHLGVPRHVARIQESIIRTEHYRALRGLGTTTELLAETKALIAGGILETARVLEGSSACGRTLAELDLRTRTGALVLSVVRGEEPLPTPGPGTRLDAGDFLVLYGPHAAIDRALELLEPRTPARQDAGG
jgi:monovalent cation:H+ antiporter-2, CPA2 family